MTICKICGKNLGFFSSLFGNTLCNDCKIAEKTRKELEKQKELKEFHEILTTNLKATTPEQLKPMDRNDQVSRNLMSSLAHSVKDDEKFYVITMATVKELKYIRSDRSSSGISAPAFGLKGFRVNTQFGHSNPIYDYRVVGSGMLVLTNKNIHLCASSGKPIKIPYSKVEGFHLYHDGLEVYHGTKKPTVFIFSNIVDPLQSNVIGHIIELHTR
jgi:hypothetical protein